MKPVFIELFGKFIAEGAPQSFVKLNAVHIVAVRDIHDGALIRLMDGSEFKSEHSANHIEMMIEGAEMEE